MSSDRSHVCRFMFWCILTELQSLVTLVYPKQTYSFAWAPTLGNGSLMPIGSTLIMCTYYGHCWHFRNTRDLILVALGSSKVQGTLEGSTPFVVLTQLKSFLGRNKLLLKSRALLKPLKFLWQLSWLWGETTDCILFCMDELGSLTNK